MRNNLARSLGSGERKGRGEVRRVGGGKPEYKKNKVGRRKRKEREREDEKEREGGEARSGTGEAASRGRWRSRAAGADPGWAPWAAPGGAAAELRAQRIPPSAERGRERERGGETLGRTRAKPSLYCMCLLLGGSPARGWV